jgi:hypothetical protein
MRGEASICKSKCNGKNFNAEGAEVAQWSRRKTKAKALNAMCAMFNAMFAM